MNRRLQGERDGAIAKAEDADMWRMHARSFDAFLSELYAIMVDPCAEGTIKRDDMMQALKNAALRDRERASVPSATRRTEALEKVYEAAKSIADGSAWGDIGGCVERLKTALKDVP